MMKTDMDCDLMGLVVNLLGKSPETAHLQLGKDSSLKLELLAGDGSSRRFYRFCSTGFNAVVVTPGSQNVAGLKEARSAWLIGSHLSECGVGVPDMYGYDQSRGIIVYEDLGVTHLYDIASATDYRNEVQSAKLMQLYHQVLENLAAMQVRGGEHFQESWCWDTAWYDRTLMLEKESGYFLRAFWKNLLQQQDVDGLDGDFQVLAEKASEAESHFFLHRDFQSRNIMVKEGRIRIIDFQGGRKGPLGYDLASLLIDPYSSLPEEMQEDLLDYYLGCLSGFVEVEPDRFRREYRALALQRNLQIIGAFSYLSRECGKTYFAQYLRPALASLNTMLAGDGSPELPVLKQVADRSLALLPGS